MYFIGIKVIAKDYLSVICPKLKSYHLKMIFFHCMQTRDFALWREENVEESFHYFISKVIDCVVAKYCPNFWPLIAKIYGGTRLIVAITVDL